MPESNYANDPTIGLIELASIARGVEVTDRLLKQAEVRVLFARFMSPGKYVTLFTGSVEAVRSSLATGVERAAESLIDQLLLPSVHDGVFRAMAVPVETPALDAVGVIETTTIAASLESADAAAKRAAVDLIELRLGRGIGGKSYFTLTGPISDVEAALAAAVEVAERGRRLVASALIPRPHPDMADVLAGHGRPI